MTKESSFIGSYPPWSTSERIRARFNVFFRTKEINSLAHNASITPEAINKYAALYPEEGRRLDRMLGHTRSSAAGLGLGFLGSLSQIYRLTKSPPVILTGTVLGTLTGYAVGDDIGSWVYGTYKFDTLDTTDKFFKWITSEQQEGQSS